MKKNVFVLNIDNYRPEICRYTLPSIQIYAEKIGAVYHEIKERRYHGWPITYEKMQVYELGKGADWNILIDADTFIHPDLPDLTKLYEPRYVYLRFAFKASTMFHDHKFFKQDGRDLGIVSNFIMTPQKYHSVWRPFDMPKQEALSLTRREFIIDELCLSMNAARLGIPISGIDEGISQMIMHYNLEEASEEVRVEAMIAAEIDFHRFYPTARFRYGKTGNSDDHRGKHLS